MRLLLVVLMMAPGGALAADCVPGTWRQGAALPVLRTEVAATSDGRAIYIVGGMSSDPAADLATVFRYDPAADRWAELARLDRAVNHTGVAVVGSKLYVIGGYEGPLNRPTARAEAIDLETGAITEVAPLLEARAALAVAVLDGRIHALGGTTDSSVATHEVYDPSGGVWTVAAPMAVPRNHLAAAELGGRIYAFGGRDESTFLLDVAEAYDPASDSWTDVAPLPTGRSGIGAAVIGDRITVFGGEVTGAMGHHTFGEAEAYDPVANNWSTLPPLPTPRHGLGVAAVGNQVFVISGGPQPGLTMSNVNEVYCD